VAGKEGKRKGREGMERVRGKYPQNKVLFTVLSLDNAEVHSDCMGSCSGTNAMSVDNAGAGQAAVGHW